MKEEWRSVVGFEDFYEVSSIGNVRGIDRVISRSGGRGNVVKRKGMILRSHDSIGYRILNLSRDGKNFGRLVHRLVAEAFIPNPENKLTVNHKNGIKHDNVVDNLEWATYSENEIHAYVYLEKIGERGEKCHFHKLKESDIFKIRESKHSNIDLSQQFNVSRNTISRVRNGRTWNHI